MYMESFKNSINKPLIFLATFCAFLYFLGVVTIVDAQTNCPAPAGAVYVNHEACIPPGWPPYPPNGKNGQPCEAIAPSGQYIQGICTWGCCEVVAYTSASSIFGGSLGGGFLEGIAEGIVVQTAVGFITNLIGGGLGTDSYSGGSGSQYGYIDDVETFLTVTDDYGNNSNNGFNLEFGTDNTNSNTNNNKGLTYSTATNTGTKTTSTGNSKNAQTTNPGDSVTTSYESLGGGSNTTGGGNTAFGNELLNSPSSAYSNSSLSLADLERSAEDARRREALLNEKNANDTGNISDYRSSGISQSGSNNSLSDGYYDSLGNDTKLSWWQRFIIFVTNTLGL